MDVSNLLKLSPGEEVIRNYHLMYMRLPRKADAYLTLTNKRLIYYDASGRGIISKSARIGEVLNKHIIAVETFIKKNNLPLLIAGALLFLISLITMMREVSSGIILFFVSMPLIALGLKKHFVLIVKCHKITPIAVGGVGSWIPIGRFKLKEDAVKVAKELFSLILETRGSELW